MGKLKQRQKDEREERIQGAIKAYNAGEGSMRAVATRFDVGYGTLQGRINGGAQPRNQAHQDVQLLDEEQEKAIVRFCLKVDEWGHPLRLSYVKAMARGMLPAEKQELIGKHWLTRFLNRHTELVSKFATRMDRQRVQANNPKVIKDYFRKLGKVIKQYHIKPEDIYNMDEKGFAMGQGSKIKVITKRGRKNTRLSQDGKRELITVIETICASGRPLPPMVINKGKGHCMSWLRYVTADRPATLAYSDKGWTDSVTGSLSKPPTNTIPYGTRSFPRTRVQSYDYLDRLREFN